MKNKNTLIWIGISLFALISFYLANSSYYNVLGRIFLIGELPPTTKIAGIELPFGWVSLIMDEGYCLEGQTPEKLSCTVPCDVAMQGQLGFPFKIEKYSDMHPTKSCNYDEINYLAGFLNKTYWAGVVFELINISKKIKNKHKIKK